MTKEIKILFQLEDTEINFKEYFEATYDKNLLKTQSELFFNEMEQVRCILEEKYFEALVKQKKHLKVIK